MITSRLELMLECDYPGCGDYPNGEQGQCVTRTMDQMDVKGTASIGKMKRVASKEGWAIYGSTAYCPRCHLKHLKSLQSSLSNLGCNNILSIKT